MDELTKLEWNILDSLSDGKETVGLILSLIKDDFEGITTKEVAENVYSLFRRKLILEDNHINVNLQILLSESINYIDNVYWFGLTEAGYKYWEQYAVTYSGKSIDWSKSWKSQTNI
jgi:hypothetical protein